MYCPGLLGVGDPGVVLDRAEEIGGEREPLVEHVPLRAEFVGLVKLWLEIGGAGRQSVGRGAIAGCALDRGIIGSAVAEVETAVFDRLVGER